MAADGNIIQRRPAEAGTPVVVAIAMLIARVFGVDDADTIGYIAVVLSFVPAAITWAVTLVRGS